jgi:hypothetical protein
VTTPENTAAAGQPANSPEGWRPSQAFAGWPADKNFVFLSGDAQPVKADPADRRFYVVHPARELIACLGCMHCRDHGRSGYMCDHPAQPIDLVTGYPKINCAAARCDNPEIALEQGATTCGSDARLFQPKRKRT